MLLRNSANTYSTTLSAGTTTGNRVFTFPNATATVLTTGNLTDIHSYTIAATEAQLMTDLTVAVRDKAVAAFEEIMRMQA